MNLTKENENLILAWIRGNGGVVSAKGANSVGSSLSSRVFAGCAEETLAFQRAGAEGTAKPRASARA